jgi:hypothetical protein
MTHYIVVHEDSPGQFTAYPCGLPELTVRAGSRAEAVTAATTKLNDCFLNGSLVPVKLPGFRSFPNSPVSDGSFAERAFEEALERSRKEDLERTLAEYEAECQVTSSTPTS